jgi:sugar-phosphatase
MPTRTDDLEVAALLFDNDGVLVDSDESSIEAWRRWAVEHDLDPETVVARIHGRRAADTVAAFVDGDRRVGAVRRINELELETADAVTALPGARELLESLEGVAWAVVSSATTPLLAARLDAAGLPRPSVLVSADDVAAGKPAPDGYRTAAARLGVEISGCAVFEDSDAGILAAIASGAGVVVGVNLRSEDHETTVRVPDLSHVSCERTSSGAARLRVRDDG